MRSNLTRTLSRLQRSFSAFTTGQKLVAILGTGALLLAGFMVFSWAAKPNMAPLYSNLSGADTAAVVDELNAQGVDYELGNNGSTVLVPSSAVYETRIALSGEGLPANTGDGDGYSLLDDQDLSTSEFKEQTDFKRAMEGELARTIEGIDGVTTAVVHLAMPEKEVFSDAQDPTTSSVLVTGRPGSTLGPDQVQAIVHLVASSVDGLDPDQVTVADSTGTVLSAPSDSSIAAASSRNQQVETVQNQMRAEIQQKLDRLVGPGNSTVQVTASLDFDSTTSESTTYEPNEDLPPLAETRERETYDGARPDEDAQGVVGADGQTELDAGNDGGGAYEKRSSTVDNAIPTTRTRTESAPGSIERLGIGILMDEQAAASVDLAELRGNMAAAVGLDPERGDSIRVSTMPFDNSAAEAAAAELEAAEEADAAAARMQLFRNVGLGVLVLAMIVLAWVKGRKRTKQRAEATTYVVEQLRADAQARAQVTAAPASTAALSALEQGDVAGSEAEVMRDELTALVERQPEDVAALLRGWLVERP